MHTTLNKLKGHIALGLSIRPSVRLLQKLSSISKNSIFLVQIICLCGVMPLLKGRNQDISKSITARSFKLSQQIEDNE